MTQKGQASDIKQPCIGSFGTAVSNYILIAAFCILTLIAGNTSSSTTNPLVNASAIDIASSYKTTQQYQITRNGKPIGKHQLSFDINGDALMVTIESTIKVRILGIPVYSLIYKASENWQDDRLIKAKATTIENGDETSVSLDNSVNENQIPYASNHWHPGVLSAGAVFNTLTGETDRLSATEIGQDTIQTNAADIPATRYRYTGDLHLDVWYDINGLWLKMNFTGEDGSQIQYLRES